MNKNQLNIIDKYFPYKRRKTCFKIFAILLVIMIAQYLYTIFFSEHYKVARNFILENAKVIYFIGHINDLRLPYKNSSGRFQYPPKYSTATLVFIIEGDKGRGKIYIDLKVSYEEWEIINAKLILDSGKEINLKE